MKQYRVAVVGATGMVGRKFLQVLEERKLPVSEYFLFASARSAGKQLPFMGKTYTVRELTDDAFQDLGIDIALFSAGGETSRHFAPIVAASGAVVIDNSSCWRMDPDVPLVVPEVNPDAIPGYKNKGIIANPNCSTIQAMVVLKPLADAYGLKRVVYSTYQAVSGAGAGGPIELQNEVEALRLGKTYEPKVFSYQIAYNLIPQIGGEQFEGYTSEEMKMQNEGRKIMHLPELKVSCTCVRVPVVRSHSVSVVLRTKEKISVERARELIAAAPGCKLTDDLASKVYPMPLDTSDQDLVYVGRIRDDLTKATRTLAPKPLARQNTPAVNSSGVIVEDIGSCMIKFSRCCTPVPGDEIIGFITKGYGVSVHRKDCPNARAALDPAQKGRWVKVTWAEAPDVMFSTSLEIEADDRDGLMLDVATILTSLRLRTSEMSARSVGGGTAIVCLRFGVHNLTELENVRTRLRGISGVHNVERGTE